jgi:hypothetical protein
MCVECTFERVNIMGCEKHDLQPIEVDPRVNSPEEMQKSCMALVNGYPAGGQLVMNTKWCAICPAYASFQCCARQIEDCEGIGEGRGCGLYLCVRCEDLMTKISNTGFWSTSEVLDRTVHLASTDRFNYDYGVRADASFLTSKGELMVRIQKGMGENTAAADADNAGRSSDGEGDAGDEEIWTILERVGKGKGKWNEKQKPPPVVQKTGQGLIIPTMQQQPKQHIRSVMGSKRQSSSENGERESQLRQMGFKPERRGGSRKVGESPAIGKYGSGSGLKGKGEVGGSESSGIGKYGVGSGSKGNGKGKGKGKTAISEVVVIDASDDD